MYQDPPRPGKWVPVAATPPLSTSCSVGHAKIAADCYTPVGSYMRQRIGPPACLIDILNRLSDQPDSGVHESSDNALLEPHPTSQCQHTHSHEQDERRPQQVGALLHPRPQHKRHETNR